MSVNDSVHSIAASDLMCYPGRDRKKRKVLRSGHQLVHATGTYPTGMLVGEQPSLLARP